MKFKIISNKGEEKIILADSLEDAVKKANKIWKKWVDIYNTDFKTGDNFKKENVK